MQTSDTFFFYDGTKVVGSHTAQEISEMFHKGLLKEDSQVCTANDHGWKALKDFPELTAKVKEKSRTMWTYSGVICCFLSLFRHTGRKNSKKQTNYKKTNICFGDFQKLLRTFRLYLIPY